MDDKLLKEFNKEIFEVANQITEALHPIFTSVNAGVLIAAMTRIMATLLYNLANCQTDEEYMKCARKFGDATCAIMGILLKMDVEKDTSDDGETS
jgi:hypothetical protein